MDFRNRHDDGGDDDDHDVYDDNENVRQESQSFRNRSIRDGHDVVLALDLLQLLRTAKDKTQ